MKKFTEIITGIRLRGESVDPIHNEEGSIWYNKVLNRLRGFFGGSVREILTADQTQAVTQKTIDADLNSISNLEVDNLKSGVLNSDLSSPAPTDLQLPSALAAKSYADAVSGAVATNLSNHINNTTGAHEASAISTVGPFTNSTEINVEGVLGDLDAATSAASGDISAHISQVTGAHAASAISVAGPLDNSSSINVEAVIGDLDGIISDNSSDIGDLQTDLGALQTSVSNHISNPTGAHAASAISMAGPFDNSAGINVETVVADLDGIISDNLTDIGTLQTNLSNHISNTTGAHAASAISTVGPFDNSTDNDVEGVLGDLDGQISTNATNISNHISDTTAAHAASAISTVGPFDNSSATDVEGVLADLDSAISSTGDLDAHINNTTGAHAASAISTVGPFDNSTAINVEGVLSDLDGEISDNATAIGTTQTNLSNHISNTTGAHAASAISVAGPLDNSSEIQVEGVLSDLDAEISANATAIGTTQTDLSNHINDTTGAHAASAISVAGPLDNSSEITVEGVLADFDAAITAAGTYPNAKLSSGQAALLESQTAADITGALFTGKSVKVLAHVEIDATAPLYSTVEIMIVKRGASWDLNASFTGDEINIDFNISAGQLNYTSGTYAGFNSAQITWFSTEII